MWNFPGAPVNESWQQNPSGSINYRLNQNLLTNLTTHCWYPSGLGGTALAGTSLEFSNGQCLLLRDPGQFQPRPAGVLWF